MNIYVILERGHVRGQLSFNKVFYNLIVEVCFSPFWNYGVVREVGLG